MKTTTTQTAEAAYLAAYNAAMASLKEIETMIHDNPAPGGEIEINWAHVGDMGRIADQLNAIVRKD